jgi:hypothetical protein
MNKPDRFTIKQKTPLPQGFFAPSPVENLYRTDEGGREGRGEAFNSSPIPPPVPLFRYQLP